MSGIGEAFADVLSGCVEMANRGFVFVMAEEFGEDFELHGNSDITLGEGVVNFAGDAIAFGEDGAKFTLCAEEAQAQGEEDEGGGEREEKQVEPDGLVEVRPQLECER